ncbi:MAG: anaerobic sulfatase maturase [Candidatus Sumerlaeia bacterium]|nr:anaerobic sulfatase maturase [Candidatus Sumerlaeia bacterium]
MARNPLTQLLIKPAGADCNLRCQYCFYLEKNALYPQRRVHRMSDEVLCEMVRQMMTTGQPQLGFSWQGGEPTLMGLDYFKAAVRYQQQFGRSGQTVANSLQTNGILINDEWCEFLAEYKFLIGLSLDGPPHIHNYYRRTNNGKPSHDFALRAADLMRRHGVEFNILAVVNEYSARFPKEIYHYFRENDMLYLQFIPCVERDPKTGAPAPFSVLPEAYGDFLCGLFDEWVKDFQNGWPVVSERTFDSLMHTYLGRPAPMCIFMETCGDYVVVEHSGDVYSCDFYVEPAQYLGNLLERDLTLLAASQKQVEFGERKRALRPPECDQCKWLRHCYGGCLKDRFTIPATQGRDYFCKAYKQFFAHSEAVYVDLCRRYIDEIQRQQEAEMRARQVLATGRGYNRNDPCPCGSGKKFKKCCMKHA